jgi:RNA polymerase sigma-70 factor (ECF subfamily)
MRGRRDLLVRGLAAACRRGDLDGLRAVLDADATAVCDGGGVVPAIGPVHGAGDVARLAAVLLRERPGVELTVEAVNGGPGLALRSAGRAVAVVAVDTAGTGITVLWIVLNPAKLHRWHSARPATG